MKFSVEVEYASNSAEVSCNDLERIYTRYLACFFILLVFFKRDRAILSEYITEGVRINECPALPCAFGCTGSSAPLDPACTETDSQ